MATSGGSIPFDELMRHEGWIRKLARQILGDDAEVDDVVQDTLSAGFLETKVVVDPRAWLSSAARNFSIRAIRDRKAREGLLNVAAAEVPKVLSETKIREREESRSVLLGFIMDLEQPCHDVVILRFYQGMSYEQIGDATGVSWQTARTRWRKAREVLREKCDRADLDGGSLRAGLILLAGGPPSPVPVAATGSSLLVASLWPMIAIAITVLVGAVALDVWLPDSQPSEVTEVSSAAGRAKPLERPELRSSPPADAPSRGVLELDPVAESSTVPPPEPEGTMCSGIVVEGHHKNQPGVPLPGQVLIVTFGNGEQEQHEAGPGGRFSFQVPANQTVEDVRAWDPEDGIISYSQREVTNLQSQSPEELLVVRVLPIDSAVRVIVTDELGRPIEGATVATRSEREFVQTDPKGVALIEVSSFSDHFPLCAWADGYGARSKSPRSPKVGEELAYSFELSQELDWSDFVLDEDGQPIIGARVQPFEPLYKSPGTETDASGKFRFRHASMGMVVEVNAAGFLSKKHVFRGPDTPRIVLVRPERLAGVVYDAITQEPISGAEVWFGDPTISGSVGGLTSGDGSFRLEFISPGTRGLLVNRGGYAPEVISVTSGDEHVEVRLRLGKSAKGVVVDDEFRPLSSARLTVEWRHELFDYAVSLTGVIRMDAEGRFELSGLPISGGRILVSAPGFNSRSFMLEEVVAGMEVLQLSRENFGSLQGQVVDADTGAPIPSFTVWLRPAVSQGTSEVTPARGLSRLWTEVGYAFHDGSWSTELGELALTIGEHVQVEIGALGYEPEVVGTVEIQASTPLGEVRLQAKP